MPQTAEAFLEEAQPSAEDFLADKPSAEAFLQADPRIAQMAAATRHTVGVVGRAVAARDFAVAGYDAPEAGRLDLEQPDESALAPVPGDIEPKAVRFLPALVSNLGKAMMKGLPFPRVTAQEVSDALSMLASGSPDLTEDEAQAVIDHTTKPGNLEKIVAGAQRALVSVPEAFTSPFGIATIGAGALPGTAGRVVAGGFAADMASHIPEQVGALKRAIATGDSEAITETAGNLLTTGVMTAATAKHALTKPKTPLEAVAPLTAEAVAKVAPVYGDTLNRPKGEQPPSTRIRELLEEGVNRPDAEALVAGTKTVQEVVEGAYGKNIVPAWNADVSQSRGGHGEAFIAGYNNAIARLTSIVTGKPFEFPAEEVMPTPLTTAAVESVKAKEPVPETPAPTPVAATSESGKPAPVTAGAEPPAKPLVTPEVTSAKRGPHPTFQHDIARAVISRELPESAMGKDVIDVSRTTVLRGSGESTSYHPMVTVSRNGKRIWRGTDREFSDTTLEDITGVKLLDAGKAGRKELWVVDDTPPAKPAGEPPLTSEPVAKAQAEPKWTMTFEEFNNAPREGALLDELRKVPKAPKTPEQIAADERDARATEAIDKAGLSWIYDRSSNDQRTRTNIEANIRKLPKAKKKIVDEYEAALNAKIKASNSGEAGQRRLYDALVERGVIRDPASEPQGAIATPGPPLAPATAPAPALPPKSQRQIITDIAQGLKLPIRFGRLRTNRFAGYFLPLQNLIGSKRANDIPIISHEAGHKLDATFNFSTDPALRAELERLGDPNAIAGSRSSWTKSKTLKYKRGEGVAEFVRYYLTDPPAAAQHAPNMARAFEAALDSNKDFGDTMRQAQSDIQTWRNAEPQARLRSHISVGGNPNKTPYTLSQLTRDLVDDLHFLRLAANDAKAAGTDLSPSQNPYTLARNLRGSYGMADSFIRSGVADFATKEVSLGTSLQDALKPVAGRIADFRDWIIAKRAQELHGQGRETGLVDSDVQFTAAKFDGDAAFQDAFTKVKAWQDALLKYAEDAGFVTADGAAAMRKLNQDYVPLHRVFEVGAGEAPAIEGAGTGRGLNVGKPGSLRRLTGSARDIVDPLETMVRNAYAIITASEKHAINIAVADMARLPDMGKWVEHIATPKERVQVGVEKLREQLEAEGADMSKVPDDVMLQFFQNSKQAPFGENVIKVVRDGKPEFYRLKRELFETFNALDLEDSGTLVRMLSAPSQVLRAGVVLDPSFALANVMRDAFTSSIVSRHGLLPFEATLRGVAAMLKSPKLVAEWEAAGGKNAIEANYFDRQKLQKFLSEKITKDLTTAERALIAVKSPLQALRWLTSLGEEATRIGEYQKAFEDFRKSGMSEGEARRQAAFESRDRQDFAKGGAKTKIPRRLAAFWNAGIQGNVRLAQAFREKPLQTTMKGLAFITIPKLIEQSLNWNDDDYWDRPQWERDLFFLIPTGKGEDGHTRFIRIPTPFEAGVIFGTFPGRILQSVRESSAENMKSFPAVLAKQTIPNPTPQWALTIFEDFMVGKKGYDVYRGRQIVPESIAQLPADMQWTEQTSLAARKLGAALGFPPVKIDHIINQTTGGLGKQLTHQVVDRAISLATGEERTAKGVVPGGRFVTTPAAVSSQAIDDFYTTLDRVKTAAEGQKKGRDDELARFKPLFTETETRMSQMRRQMRNATNETEKNQIAEDILKLARETMDNFRKQSQ